MKRSFSIRPSKELRTNYHQISTIAKDNPVAITVNGKVDIVVLSYEDYVERQRYINELETRLAVYEHQAQAMDDIKLGRTQPLDEAFAGILRELDEGL